MFAKIEFSDVTGGEGAISGFPRVGKGEATSGGLRGTKECKGAFFSVD